MNKRNAEAAAAAANGEGQDESSTVQDDNVGSGIFSLPDTTASERLRNPFEDYEDDEVDNSGSGSEDGEVENVESDAANAGSSTTWNRGSWWRGVVRGARRGGSNRQKEQASDEMEETQEVERFGDGRDDDSSDSDGGRGMGDVDDLDDEEFGDFAMPEVDAKDPPSAAGGTVSGIDPDREKFLVKPMPVHPTPIKSSVSPFSGLWPFSSQGFGGKDKDKEKKKEGAETAMGEIGADPFSGGAGTITEEPVELTQEEEEMLSEDGKRINRAVEAKRRTSIEEPDEDEGEEIIVHKSTGGR